MPYFVYIHKGTRRLSLNVEILYRNIMIGDCDLQTVIIILAGCHADIDCFHVTSPTPPMKGAVSLPPWNKHNTSKFIVRRLDYFAFGMASFKVPLYVNLCSTGGGVLFATWTLTPMIRNGHDQTWFLETSGCWFQKRYAGSHACSEQERERERVLPDERIIQNGVKGLPQLAVCLTPLNG